MKTIKLFMIIVILLGTTSLLAKDLICEVDECKIYGRDGLLDPEKSGHYDECLKKFRIYDYDKNADEEDVYSIKTKTASGNKWEMDLNKGDNPDNMIKTDKLGLLFLSGFGLTTAFHLVLNEDLTFKTRYHWGTWYDEITEGECRKPNFLDNIFFK